MAPRHIVHILLIISELIIIAVSITIIINYQIMDYKEKVWMGSKIFSVENVIRANNNYTYPMTYIGGSGIFYAYKAKYNYDYLLKHSGSSCEEHYKKCGILDTMGNIMCIPETDECPINDVIDEETYNKTNNPEEYIKSGDLYYSNKKTENSIITKVSYSWSNNIINNSTLVFDEDAYDEFRPKSSSSYDSDYQSSEVYIKPNYETTDAMKYIRERLKDDINKDKSYRKLCEDTYGGNYLGFKDYSSLEKFTNLDLYQLYFISFPNKTADVFCYIFLAIFTGMIIYSISRIYKEDENNGLSNSDRAMDEQIVLHMVYIICFVGFFLYIVYEYDNIYNQMRHEELLEIKGDPFFEDLIQEIYDRNPKPYVFFIFITLYIVSLILFILAWILNHCFAKFNKKYPSGRKHPLTSSNFDEEEKKY